MGVRTPCFPLWKWGAGFFSACLCVGGLILGPAGRVGRGRGERRRVEVVSFASDTGLYKGPPGDAVVQSVVCG